MKKFISVNDAGNLEKIIAKALQIKSNKLDTTKDKEINIGSGKTLGLIFLNPSLRTRLSSQKAALNIGMQVITMNAVQEAWSWELSNNIMNGSSVEHIKDAAKIIGNYCDIVGIRCFPELKNRETDYAEEVLNKFIDNCDVPVISLESATRHPLQSFADIITIKENLPLINEQRKKKIKVALTWAPHIKPLPQAVANSFAEWMLAWKKEIEIEFCITQPKGYELNEEFTKGAEIYHSLDTLNDADFVYVKNWSAYSEYGTMPMVSENWMLDANFLAQNPNAKIMHCMPVRRNLELGSDLIDSENSLLYKQANNRTFAMKTVLQSILENHV